LPIEIEPCQAGNQKSEIQNRKFSLGQTPDLPATHAVIATVAPFPAWRGSQDMRCAEPEV